MDNHDYPKNEFARCSLSFFFFQVFAKSVHDFDYFFDLTSTIHQLRIMLGIIMIIMLGGAEAPSFSAEHPEHPRPDNHDYP